MKVLHQERSIAYAVFAAVTFFSIPVFAASSPVPTQWTRSFRTPVQPVRDYYYGPISKATDAAKKKGGTATVYYTVWGKVVYKRLQGGGQQYLTDVLELQVDCSSTTVSTLREVRYDQAGKVISDTSNSGGAHSFDPDDSRNLGKLPLNEGLAIDTWELTCDSSSR